MLWRIVFLPREIKVDSADKLRARLGTELATSS